MEKINITGRTKINRLPNRGFYDWETIYNILDDSFVCQIGFNIVGKVFVIPTLYGRKGDSIFIHGSKNSRMLETFEKGEEICLTVTHVEGIVLARSAFHHSVNYRSAVIFGRPEKVTGNPEKKEALKAIMDHIIPGRWEEVRAPNEKELSVTAVFELRIEEASAKVRTGPANDDKEDLDLNVWAGVLPLKTAAGEPVENPDMKAKAEIPGYIRNYKKL